MRKKGGRKDTGEQPHGREASAPTTTIIAQHQCMGAARRENIPPSPDKPYVRTEKQHPPDSDRIATSAAQSSTVRMHGPHTSDGSTTQAGHCAHIHSLQWRRQPQSAQGRAQPNRTKAQPSSNRPRTPHANKKNVPASLEVVEIPQVVGCRQRRCLLLVRQRAEERQCQYLHGEGAGETRE